MRRRPKKYCRTAQLAPPCQGSPATMPLSRIFRRSMGQPHSTEDLELVHEFPEHQVGIEMLHCDGSRRSTVMLVIGRDALYAGHCLVEASECDQPVTNREASREPRVLHESRAP